MLLDLGLQFVIQRICHRRIVAPGTLHFTHSSCYIWAMSKRRISLNKQIETDRNRDPRQHKQTDVSVLLSVLMKAI